MVVDTSKSLAPPALAALRPADEVYLVTNLDLCSLRNFKRCLPILKEIGGADAKRLRLIVNRYTKNGLLSIDDLESTVGLPVHRTLRNDFQSVIGPAEDLCSNDSLGVRTVAPGSRLRRH